MRPSPPQVALARRAAKLAPAGQQTVAHWRALPESERAHAKEQIGEVAALTRRLVGPLREMAVKRPGTPHWSAAAISRS